MSPFNKIPPLASSAASGPGECVKDFLSRILMRTCPGAPPALLHTIFHRCTRPSSSPRCSAESASRSGRGPCSGGGVFFSLLESSSLKLPPLAISSFLLLDFFSFPPRLLLEACGMKVTLDALRFLRVFHVSILMLAFPRGR